MVDDTLHIERLPQRMRHMTGPPPRPTLKTASWDHPSGEGSPAPPEPPPELPLGDGTEPDQSDLDTELQGILDELCDHGLPRGWPCRSCDQTDDVDQPEDAPPDDPDAETQPSIDPELFWSARPALTHIRDFAQARRVGPWAVLGCTLARLVASIAPHVQLPALVGGHASLNLFVALVGTSGAGKGAADAAARDLLTLRGSRFADELTPGSGEGLGHMFARFDPKAKAVERVRHNVLLSVPEVDTLTALGGRQGATLSPELRKAWTGEPLGFGYADPTRRLHIPSHSYRLCLLLGMQPLRAEPILADADGGTPQRFLWLPTIDPDAPEQRPPEPAGIQWQMPRWPTADHAGRTTVTVPPLVIDAIEDSRLATLRGHTWRHDPLAGHAALCRLKTAAALALLDQRTDIDEQDWQLAGVLMTVSDRTRAGVQATISAELGRRNDARGEAEARRAAVVSDRLDERATARALAAILRCVQGHADRPGHEHGCRRRCLRQACNPRFRDSIDAAITRAVDAGQLIAEPAKQGGLHYTRGKTP